MSSSHTISVSELERLSEFDPSIRLIHVRPSFEFSSVHADGAVNVRLDRVSAEAIGKDARTNPERVHVIYKSGMRSNRASQELVASGMTDVVNIDGRTDAWVAADLPVVCGKPSYSVEQQARIVAGFMVMAGVWLSTAVRLEYIGVSAFVGAGLLMAGVTGWCPTGTILARMPWYQKGSN